MNRYTDSAALLFLVARFSFRTRGDALEMRCCPRRAGQIRNHSHAALNAAWPFDSSGSGPLFYFFRERGRDGRSPDRASSCRICAQVETVGQVGICPTANQRQFAANQRQFTANHHATLPLCSRRCLSQRCGRRAGPFAECRGRSRSSLFVGAVESQGAPRLHPRRSARPRPVRGAPPLLNPHRQRQFTANQHHCISTANANLLPTPLYRQRPFTANAYLLPTNAILPPALHALPARAAACREVPQWRWLALNGAGWRQNGVGWR